MVPFSERHKVTDQHIYNLAWSFVKAEVHFFVRSWKMGTGGLDEDPAPGGSSGTTQPTWIWKIDENPLWDVLSMKPG